MKIDVIPYAIFKGPKGFGKASDCAGGTNVMIAAGRVFVQKKDVVVTNK